MSKLPDTVEKLLIEELKGLSDEQFAGYLKGYEAARRVGVYAPGAYGTDVIVAVEAFKKRLPALRPTPKA